MNTDWPQKVGAIARNHGFRILYSAWAVYVLATEIGSRTPMKSVLIGLAGIVLAIESLIFFVVSLLRARWTIPKVALLGVFVWLAVGYGKWVWISWHSWLEFMDSFARNHPEIEVRPVSIPWWGLFPRWSYVGAVLLFVFGILLRIKKPPSQHGQGEAKTRCAV